MTLEPGTPRPLQFRRRWSTEHGIVWTILAVGRHGHHCAKIQNLHDVAEGSIDGFSENEHVLDERREVGQAMAIQVRGKRHSTTKITIDLKRRG